MFANVSERSICSCYVGLWFLVWRFLWLFGLFCVFLYLWGLLVFLASLLCTKLGLFWCASNWARPLGVVWLGHYLSNLLGECLAAHKIPRQFLELFQIYGSFVHHKSFLLALAGQPSLHGYDACMIYWAKGALRRNRRQKYCKASFSPFRVFLLSRNSKVRVRFWGLVIWHLWIGRARHPGPPPPDQFFGLEVFNVGYGDFALDARVDFLAVVEHRLIPARVRSEWDRLRRKGLASVWAPACQDSSHVGNAGVGVISMRGAPIALPSFATSEFKMIFDCGRAVRCLSPLGAGRFMHLFVLYGYQGG